MGVHSNTKKPNYLGKQTQAQNQRLYHWGRSIGGGLRSVFGASSSSGQGGSGGYRAKRNRQTITAPLSKTDFGYRV